MKKNLFSILVIVMMVSLILPLGVFANEGIEKHIPKIKQIFEIGDEYTRFDVRIRDHRGEMTHDISWRNDSNRENISVETDLEGNILRYSKYTSRNDDEHGKFPKIPKEEALKTAKDIIRRIDPNILDKMEYEDRTIMGNLNNYHFRFVRNENGLPFNYNSVSVNVNNYTGEIENVNIEWDKDLKLPNKDNIINEEEAYKLYKEGQDLELIYKLENKDNNVEGNLLYTIKNINKNIDSKTGKVIEDLNDMSRYVYYGSLYSSLKKVSLEDTERLVSSKKIVSKVEVEKELRRFADLDSSYTLQAGELKKDELDGSYVWEIQIHKQEGNSGYGTSVTVDARTKEVLNFHKFSGREEGEKIKYSETEALKKAEEFLNKNMKDKYKEVEYGGSSFYDLSENIRQYSFKFNRLADGIRIPQNGFSLSVSSTTGEIMNYDYMWNDIELLSKEEVIGKEEAKKILLSDSKLELTYIIDKESAKNNKKEVKLVYKLAYEEGVFLDAKTGEKLSPEDYMGINHMDEREKEYKDIDKSYAKAQVEKLKENGIYLPGEEFLPKEDIVQKDFLYLLSNTKGYISIYDEDYIYDRFSRETIIKEEEKKPEGTITRGEAITYVVRSFGQEKAASLKDVYKSNYDDIDSIPKELKGYVAVAEGLGILNGEGRFRANDNLTREEAMMIIYNILNR